MNPKALSLGAVFGPIMFSLSWLVLGFMSPGYTIYGTVITSYSVIAQPISGLGLGLTGPWMNAAFIVFGGIFLLAGIIAVFLIIPGMGKTARFWSMLVLAMMPLGTIGCGLFTLEAGFAHYLSAMIAFGAAVPGFLIAGLSLRRLPGWQRLGRWLIIASPLTVALIVVYMASFDPVTAGANQGFAGLAERLLALEVHGWFVLLGWKTWLSQSRKTNLTTA